MGKIILAIRNQGQRNAINWQQGAQCTCLVCIEVMRGSASLHINSVKHALTVVVYGVVAMLEGGNVLAVLGKVRFIAITHDKRYSLQFDSCQENCR